MTATKISRHQKILITLLFAFSVLLSTNEASANWQIKQGPMMTTWAKDINPEKVLPEYPRPQLVRNSWINLNGIWDLRKGTVDEEYTASFTYDKSILVPFPLESALSGVMEKSDEQCYWYRRTFSLPETMRSKHILLNFGAVDWQCKVYVNGKKVGEHTGGYDPFTFDITDALNSDSEQEIAVYIYDNTGVQGQPTGKQSKSPSICWYTAVSGIWQTVWIEPVDPVYIKSIEMEPTVARNWMSFRIDSSDPNATANITIKDRSGNVAGELKNAKVGSIARVTINNPHLWSPSDPYLYDVDIALVNNGKTTDNVKSYCAMRSIKVATIDGITRIVLNGNEIFQFGPLDQGFWPDGIYTAPSDEALLFDIKSMKEIGFNMIRKHIKVEPDRWYYHCDHEGILVWQDLPSPNLPKGSEDFAKSNFRDESKNIIRSIKNHPSIVQWIVFNEGWGQFDTVDMTNYVDGLVNSLSPSRYGKASLICCASGWTDAEVGNIIDNHSYPYPAFSHSTTRAAVCGEYGGITLKVPGHIWPGGDFQYTVVETKSDFTAYFNMLCDKIKLGYYSGLNAAVYTQLSDVEIEKNGLWTYDRKVFKSHDLAELRAKVLECVNMPSNGIMRKTILSTAATHNYTWRYTTDTTVPRHWYECSFDDSEWNTGKAAFGNGGPDNTQYLLKTKWDNNQIHMRRWFYLGDISQENINKLMFEVFHDDDITIYLNGVFAATASGCNFNYAPLEIDKFALSTLKANSWNLIAVDGRQGTGQQIMDVGLTAFTKSDFSYTENFDGLTDPKTSDQPEVSQAAKPKFKKLEKPVPAEGKQQGGNSATAEGQFLHTSDRSNVAWGDIDNDGQLELTYSGHDGHLASPDVAALYKYHDGAFARISCDFSPAFYACPTWIDYNNDGRLDLFVPGFNSYKYEKLDDVAAFLYKNIGPDNLGNIRFEEVNYATPDSNAMGIAPIYNPQDGGRSRHWVATGDYDNDGYTDIAVIGHDDYYDASETDSKGNPILQSDRRVLYLYRNNCGNGFVRQELPLNGKDEFTGLSRGSVWFADMDSDGWLDIVASGYGAREGNLTIYYNNGDGTFSQSGQDFIGTFDGTCYPVDINADGLIDIVSAGYSNPSGNGSCKNFHIYQNLGNRNFTFLPIEYCGFEGVDGATPDIADVNNDGLPDILVGGHGATHEITTWLYLNNGDFSFTPVGAYYQDTFGKSWSFDRISHGNSHLLDFNHDGYLDAWTMGWAQSNVCSNACSAGIYANQSSTLGIAANTAPTIPGNLNCRYDKSTGLATFMWDASTDDFTPSAAIQYNFYIKKKGDDKISMVIPANLSDGSLKVNQFTNQIMTTFYTMHIDNDSQDYEWGVQAIDNGRMSSRFASSSFNPATASAIGTVRSNGLSISASKGAIHYNVSEQTVVKIYTANAELIKSVKVKGNGIINDLASGIYIVSAKSKSGQTKNIKLHI